MQKIFLTLSASLVLSASSVYGYDQAGQEIFLETVLAHHEKGCCGENLVSPPACANSIANDESIGDLLVACPRCPRHHPAPAEQGV